MAGKNSFLISGLLVPVPFRLFYIRRSVCWFAPHPFSGRPWRAVGAALPPLALPPRQPVRARHPWLPGLPVPPRVACVGEFGSSHSVADGQLHRIARGMYIMQDRKPLNKKLTH